MSTFFDRFLAHGFMVCNAEYRVNDGTPDGAVAPAAVQDTAMLGPSTPADFKIAAIVDGYGPAASRRR